ncbi:MAG: sugar isomerase [bacterium]|nr:sugar isomerase [bacterium]
MYDLPQRRDKTSWRSWGDVQTPEAVAGEKQRVQSELSELKDQAEFPLEILPIVEALNPDQASNIAKGEYDVTLIYAAGGWGNTLEALSAPDKWTLVFVRHRTGSTYLWYEIVHNRYLRKTVDQFGQPGVGPEDVVVDEVGDVLLRLRALYALKNTMNKRIVALGGASGWGEGGREAPQRTRDRFNMEIIDVTYDDLGERIKQARNNPQLMKRCERDAQAYLKQEGVSLETDPAFMTRAFLLTGVIKKLMQEAQTDAFTINNCMGTVMGIAETTACMPLSLINDEGAMAFCESDFVVIPSGILLRYLSNKPVFLNDPTYPHHGLVTLAHCTAPRKMDGENAEPVRILTHFESDYGAAPKVEMKLGEKITVIDPDFNFERWMGFTGEIVDNPFMAICRSQIDVQLDADTDRVNEETRGFHWMASYGDYLQETGYALKKANMGWLNLTA